MSDDSLLSILSNSMSVESVKPHLCSLFNDVGSIVLAKKPNKDVPSITGVESREGETLKLNQPVNFSYNLHLNIISVVINYSICIFVLFGGVHLK